MSDYEQTRLRLDVCLAEYDKLKSEQAQRIALRDNLAYATLVATAGVIVFAFGQDGNSIGLMALPFACFILGLLHTVNDEKSSSIGRYLRTTLRAHISELTGDKPESVFAWESVVRTTKYRRWRKVVQLIANLSTFVVPGALGMAAYWLLAGTMSWGLVVATAIEGALLLVLTCSIIWEADIGERPKTPDGLPTPGDAPNPGAQTKR